MLRLVQRDILIYLKNQLLVIVACALLVIFVIGGSDFLSSFGVGFLWTVLFAAIAAAQTTFLYDEKAQSNRLIRAMPITPAAMVLARYIACFVYAAASALLFSVIYLFASLCYPALGGVFAPLPLLLCTVMVTICFMALLLPFLYRFGYQKSRYPLIIAMSLIGSSAPMLLSLAGQNQELLATLLASPGIGGYTLMLVAVLLLLYGSVKISVAILSHKEM